MGCVELNEIEEKIVKNCNKFLWNQRVINHAESIISYCDSDERIKDFFKECESKVKDGKKSCRIVYNTETFNFGADEFSYVFFFVSDVLNLPIKLSVKIDIFEQIIVFGNMTLPSKKEKSKLQKHLGSDDGISLNSSIDLNKREVAN
jgi:hypothetical protein